MSWDPSNFFSPPILSPLVVTAIQGEFNGPPSLSVSMRTYLYVCVCVQCVFGYGPMLNIKVTE